ncbi:RHS repeat domain-containing protein, partial [Desulfovibrio cuneatus]|uniref:RHS repeat domain-containing protein n=1 Tax=Desulfovibrio cuneatus TaxID=159728 RepID=UPI00047F1A24
MQCQGGVASFWGIGAGARGNDLGQFGTNSMVEICMQREMTTEEFLREVVFGGNKASGSRGTLLATTGGRPAYAAAPAPSAPHAMQQSQGPGALLEGQNRGMGSSAVFSMQCQTNSQHKVVGKTEQTPAASKQWQYAYDGAGHLTSVVCNGKQVERYAYNAKGQRCSDQLWHQGVERKFTYNAKGQLTEAGAAQYYYEKTGALHCKKEGRKNTYYSYGNDTRLDKVILPSGVELRYEYGKSLMPIRSFLNGRPAWEYQWQGETRLVACYDVMQGTHYAFHYAEQRMPVGVTITGTGAELVQEQARYGTINNYCPAFSQNPEQAPAVFLHIGVNQVGSVRTLSTDSGILIKEMQYDSFGTVVEDTFVALTFPLGFCGGLVDGYTGFVRFGYRDYDPATGRFTSLDPLGDTGGDHDLYDYCVDDPVSMNDPSGLIAPAVLGAFLAGKAAALGLGVGGAWVAGKMADTIHSERDETERTEAVDGVKKTLSKTAAISGVSTIPGAVVMGAPVAGTAFRAASAASAAAAQRIAAG